uniref:Uncharacterized protein n=1 Tax=Arundo donax TaxID=35708 RepID=A0A0A9EPP6_ARUDO
MSKSVERNIGNVGTHFGVSKNIKAQHSKGNSDVGPSKATSRCSLSYFRDIIFGHLISIREMLLLYVALVVCLSMIVVVFQET